MAEVTKTDKAPKKSWTNGLKSEFNKIVWTNKKTLIKQTIAVVVVSIILGALIAVLDSAILEGLNFLIK